MSKYGVFSGPYFPVFSPNKGKYGPEITPYLDTIHAVKCHPWCFYEIGFIKKRITGMFTILAFLKRQNMMQYSFIVARIYITLGNFVPIKNLYDTSSPGTKFHSWQWRNFIQNFDFTMCNTNSVKKLTKYRNKVTKSEMKRHVSTLLILHWEKNLCSIIKSLPNYPTVFNDTDKFSSSL